MFPDVEKGILVPTVIPGSPADRAGFKQGDVVVRFDGKPVETVKEIDTSTHEDDKATQIRNSMSGFGHQDWVRTHEAASSTYLVVSTLVEGGATCVGKTVVDELAFGISGENKQSLPQLLLPMIVSLVALAVELLLP